MSKQYNNITFEKFILLAETAQENDTDTYILAKLISAFKRPRVENLSFK